MNTQPSKSSAAQTGPTVGPAVLVLDEGGHIQSASRGAATLWQAGPAELVGDRFPNLFQFEVTSKDPDLAQAQWEVVLAAAQDQPITLKLQPKEAAAFDAEVRIEKAGDDPVHYFAHVQRPSVTAPPAAPTPAPPAGTRQEFLSLLNERSPLGFFDLNFVDQQIFYSPAWKSMLGYADADLPNTYDSWLKLIHPEDTAAAPDRKGRNTSPGTRPFSLEFRLKHADGHYVWVHSAGVQLYGPNGALQRVVGAHLDIQDRKEFEETGVRAEECLEQLGGEAGLGAFDFDFTTGRYWYSPAFLSLLGAANAPEGAPETFLNALPPDEAAGGLEAWLTRHAPGERSFAATLLLRHADGRSLPFAASVARMLSRKKELQRAVGYIVPAPAAAAGTGHAPSAQPTEQLGVLLHEMLEGVLFADTEGRVTYLNPKAAKLLGGDPPALVGQPAADVFRMTHRSSGQPGIAPVDNVIATGESLPLNDEFAIEMPGGARHPVTWSCHPVADQAGRPVGAVLVFRNPEEMTLTPEELVRANRFDALGQLAGGIAHDFNNLLTTILGGVSLAKDSRDQSGLENSERACLAAKALSKQLLTFSKGGAGVRQVIKTGDMLVDAVRLAAAGSVVKVESAIAPDLAPISVDRAQILQVFQNLIINAIQAMPEGKGNIWINTANVELAADQIPPLPAGPYVAVEVRDNGSGISPENLDKIFSPFFTTKKTGTGLGLATVLSIVKRHGGQLAVDSVMGEGTTFTIFLPPATEEIQVEARRAPSLRFADRTGRVLFMDDDAEICHLTGVMLQGLDYKYDIAKNGEEAIQLYKRYLNIGRPYDAVIMDLTIIGGMGGEQCFKHLRELDPQVRAIIASGYDNEDMARQFLDMGFLGYLTKPYRIADLGRVLKGVLGG